MTNPISTRLSLLQAQGRVGLMTHAVIGYPSVAQTVVLGKALAEAGADFLELQIPFSDPLADGPSIRRASELALANGTRVCDAFTVAKQLSEVVETPLIFMTYYNIVYRYGVAKFCVEAAKAGVAGLIVPDAPIEEAEREGLLRACHKNNLHYIPTLAPTSTPARIAKNAEIAQGLLYCMSRSGVTGIQQGFDVGLADYLERVRQHAKTPLAVGFGVSSPEQVRELASLADVIVVGSAIVDRLATSAPGQGISMVAQFVASLAAETHVTKKDTL